MLIRLLIKEYDKAAVLVHGEDAIRVRQFITDIEGHKLAAVIDMEELRDLEFAKLPFSFAVMPEWFYPASCVFAGFRLKGIAGMTSGINGILAISTSLIPASEGWLYKNNEALQIVRKGLEDAAEGRMSKLNLDEL